MPQDSTSCEITEQHVKHTSYKLCLLQFNYMLRLILMMPTLLSDICELVSMCVDVQIHTCVFIETSAFTLYLVNYCLVGKGISI